MEQQRRAQRETNTASIISRCRLSNTSLNVNLSRRSWQSSQTVSSQLLPPGGVGLSCVEGDTGPLVCVVVAAGVRWGVEEKYLPALLEGLIGAGLASLGVVVCAGIL